MHVFRKILYSEIGARNLTHGGSDDNIKIDLQDVKMWNKFGLFK